MRMKLAPRLQSEEEEASAKLRLLVRLQAELVERELFLTNLHSEIRAFELRYMREVGSLYLMLDEWNRKIATKHAEALRIDITTIRQELAELLGEEPDSSVSCDSQHPTGSFSSQEKEDFSFLIDEEPAFAAEVHPYKDLRAAYREVAKRVHPDFAIDERDRQKREVLMKEANSAYQRGDLEALRSILEEYEDSAEWVQKVDRACELERVTRQITRIQNRLKRIEEEIVSLLASDIGNLKQRADASSARGRDLLAEMADDIRRRIDAAKESFSGASTEEG